MMEVETYTYEDTDESHSLYLMIESWFEGRFPEPELLPKLGVLVKEDDEYLCFVCADMSNNIPRAYIDYLMTNPEIGATKRYKAAKLAEEFLCERLRDHGYSLIYGMTPHAGIASLSQKLGFQVDMTPNLAIYKLL